MHTHSRAYTAPVDTNEKQKKETKITIIMVQQNIRFRKMLNVDFFAFLWHIIPHFREKESTK